MGDDHSGSCMPPPPPRPPKQLHRPPSSSAPQCAPSTSLSNAAHMDAHCSGLGPVMVDDGRTGFGRISVVDSDSENVSDIMCIAPLRVVKEGSLVDVVDSKGAYIIGQNNFMPENVRHHPGLKGSTHGLDKHQIILGEQQMSDLEEKNQQVVVPEHLNSLEGSAGDRSRACRWSREETLTLVLVKRQYEDEVAMLTKRGQMINKDLKWNQISEMCALRGVQRNSTQCRKRWQDTISIYKKIKDWESRSGHESYWVMSPPMKKNCKLPSMFEKEVFDELDKFMKSRPRMSPLVVDSDLSDNLPCSHDEEQQLGVNCDMEADEDVHQQEHPSPSGECCGYLPDVHDSLTSVLDEHRHQQNHLSPFGGLSAGSLLGRSMKSRFGSSPIVDELDVQDGHSLPHDNDQHAHQQHCFGSSHSSSRESGDPPSTGKRKRQTNGGYNESQVEHWTKVLKENTAAVVASNDRANQLIEKQTQTVVSVFQQINLTMKSLLDKL